MLDDRTQASGRRVEWCLGTGPLLSEVSGIPQSQQPPWIFTDRGYEMAPTPVAHFAINVDDVDLTKAFYSEVFGWKFTSGG